MIENNEQQKFYDAPTQSAAQVGTNVFTPFGTRFIVEQDKFRSGYECKQCDGEGSSACTACADESIEKKFKCVQCNGTTRIQCRTCKGLGGILIVQENAKRRPSTGIVRAVGEDVKKKFLLEKRVMYSNFAGFHVELENPDPSKKNKIVLVFLDESELISRLDGTIGLKEQTADFTANT